MKKICLLILITTINCFAAQKNSEQIDAQKNSKSSNRPTITFSDDLSWTAQVRLSINVPGYLDLTMVEIRNSNVHMRVDKTTRQFWIADKNNKCTSKISAKRIPPRLMSQFNEAKRLAIAVAKKRQIYEKHQKSWCVVYNKQDPDRFTCQDNTSLLATASSLLPVILGGEEDVFKLSEFPLITQEI